jgi:ribosomal protein S7
VSAQVRIVEHAFDIIHLLTDQNPIQIVVDAIINRYSSSPASSSSRLGRISSSGVSSSSSSDGSSTTSSSRP